jgi:hypothetical protein
MQRSKLLALTFLAAALLIGGAVGFTVDRMMAGERSCAPGDRQSMRERMAADLSLTAAQRVTFDSLLENRHHEMNAVMEPVRPQLDSIRQQTRVEIARMLDDGQRVRYEQMLEEARVAREKREAGVTR